MACAKAYLKRFLQTFSKHSWEILFIGIVDRARDGRSSCPRTSVAMKVEKYYSALLIFYCITKLSCCTLFKKTHDKSRAR